MSSIFRMLIPLSLLTVLFLGIGYYVGGTAGIVVAFLLAGAMNFLTYWYSDRIVLSVYGAKKVSAKDYPEIDASLKSISEKAGIPKPPLYYVNSDVPNAFATGRSPSHAAVAVTKGLLAQLNTEEIEAVLAHEIGHVKNRDTLTATVAATIAGAITWISYLFFFGDRDNRGIASYLLLFILAPLAAAVLQMSLSRSREFAADKTGAYLSDPLHLASALEKISSHVAASPMAGNSSFSALFIVNPFRLDTVARLFSTHPPVEERVSILRKMAV